jgi:hypothetical protein
LDDRPGQMGFSGPDRALQQHRISGLQAAGQPTTQPRRVIGRGKMKLCFGPGIGHDPSLSGDRARCKRQRSRSGTSLGWGFWFHGDLPRLCGIGAKRNHR